MLHSSKSHPTPSHQVGGPAPSGSSSTTAKGTTPLQTATPASPKYSFSFPIPHSTMSQTPPVTSKAASLMDFLNRTDEPATKETTKANTIPDTNEPIGLSEPKLSETRLRRNMGIALPGYPQVIPGS